MWQFLLYFKSKVTRLLVNSAYLKYFSDTSFLLSLFYLEQHKEHSFPKLKCLIAQQEAELVFHKTTEVLVSSGVKAEGLGVPDWHEPGTQDKPGNLTSPQSSSGAWVVWTRNLTPLSSDRQLGFFSWAQSNAALPLWALHIWRACGKDKADHLLQEPSHPCLSPETPGGKPQHGVQMWGWGARVKTMGREARGDLWEEMVPRVGWIRLHIEQEEGQEENMGIWWHGDRGESILVLLWLHWGPNPPGDLNVRCLSIEWSPDHATSLASRGFFAVGEEGPDSCSQGCFPLLPQGKGQGAVLPSFFP